MNRLFQSFLFVTLLLCGLHAVAAERTTYYIPDAQGSPVAAMDEQGNLLWRESYAPYGERRTRPAGNKAANAYTGKPEDTSTGLVYMGARWYDPETARFTGIDPLPFRESNLQSFNAFAYANNSPYVFVDPDGRDVVIAVERTTYTDKSIVGTLTVTSDKTKSTFKGYSLENAKAGDAHDKLPIPAGSYDATIREDHKPNRVELQDVPGYSNVQVHVGNSPADLKGCIAPGNKTSKNYVSGSKKAMKAILKIVEEDGTNNISVQVTGERSVKP